MCDPKFKAPPIIYLFPFEGDPANVVWCDTDESDGAEAVKYVRQDTSPIRDSEKGQSDD